MDNLLGWHIRDEVAPNNYLFLEYNIPLASLAAARTFENDIHIVKEKFVEAMESHNLRMTPTAHVLVYQVPSHVCRTGVPLGPTSEQALKFRLNFFCLA